MRNVFPIKNMINLKILRIKEQSIISGPKVALLFKLGEFLPIFGNLGPAHEHLIEDSILMNPLEVKIRAALTLDVVLVFDVSFLDI
jgi:hypothetical protein